MPVRPRWSSSCLSATKTTLLNVPLEATLDATETTGHADFTDPIKTTECVASRLRPRLACPSDHTARLIQLGSHSKDYSAGIPRSCSRPPHGACSSCLSWCPGPADDTENDLDVGGLGAGTGNDEELALATALATTRT